jgi:hypothetical protein
LDRFAPDRILKDKLLFLLVPKQNGARFGPHLFNGYVKGRFDELFQIDRLKQGVADAFDRFELRLVMQQPSRIMVERISQLVR